MAKMTNPLDETQFNRLHNSIEWANRQLEFPRKKRIESVKQFTGFHYTEGGSAKRVPVSFLKLAVSIYVRLLAARAPRALFSTKEPELKYTAANLELAVNQIPGEIALQATLKRLVTESLFSFGIAKCGLCHTGEVLGHNYGTSFVDVVTLDDLIIDMAAKHIDQIQYMGNDYWLDYDEVMESKGFIKKSLSGLKPDDYTVLGEAGEERAESITSEENAALFKEKVWFRDVWLPAEGFVLTYGVKTERVMKVVDWTGPERGPYSILGYNNVPGNLLPLPPVAAWRDLHELGNALFRKLGDQADAAKTVQGFQGDNDDSVKNFQNAVDGDGIFYHGTEPKPLKAGGVDSNTLLFFLQLKDLASYFGGNVDTLGGLSAQAETLGQDKLLSDASSAQLRDMASEVVAFTKGIFTALAHYEWHDPVRRRKLEKSIPGTDLSIVIPWDRKARRGKFDMYDLEIDIYSLQDDSPGLKLQKLSLIMREYVLPLMPAIEREGGTLSAQKILQIVAKYADFEELSEIVQFMQELGVSGSEEPAGMPQDTTRTNVRINRPGATDKGKSDIMQQVLLGGRPQGDQMAAIGRQTG